jgi:tetratricopeptide (TPR) repeat protein
MVRMRCGIVEDEEPSSARAKLQTALAEHISDPEERQWVEPRLAHLLALEGAPAGDQENLFSAWRILFERLAERAPTVLVFEDMQWADAGLLDFIEYLLDWSHSLPLFVVVLARPEFADKRPSWGAGRRSFSSLYLEPLPPQAMDDLLAGLVPGLPDELRGSILSRAEGIPLYAVETVRMLLDRGLLARDGEVYRPVGPIETLEVPETLQALIAARLDSLASEERVLLQDASVLGKVFTKRGLQALTAAPDGELDPLLAALVRKEMLSIQADPQSPEHGQYSFLQDLVRWVAYETISRRERKAKHMAAAKYLLSLASAEEGETIEVVASHYLDAYAAAPDDTDAPQIRSTACEMFTRAGERAASLAANVQAQQAFERAIEMTDDPLAQAELHERAGVAAAIGARAEEASPHFEKSIALFEAQGAAHPAARVSARLAEILWDRGRLEEGLESMERSLAVLLAEEADEAVASLAAQVARFRYFAGDMEIAYERVETALTLAETLSLPEVLSQALNTRAVILRARGRRNESSVLLGHALEVALEHDKPSAALRAYFNLADSMGTGDRYDEAADLVRQGLAYARKVGNRYWEWSFLGQSFPLYALGAWDDVLAMRDELPRADWTRARIAFATALHTTVAVYVHRGRLEEAKRMASMLTELERSADVQERCIYGVARAHIFLGERNPREALPLAESVFAQRDGLGIDHDTVKEAFVLALQAGLELGQLDKVVELLTLVERLPSGLRPQFLNANVARFRAQLAASTGNADEAERLFKGAGGLFQELGVPFYLAMTRLEHAEWLASLGRGEEAEPLLTEASGIFTGLQAKPWFERLEGVQAGKPAEIPA